MTMHIPSCAHALCAPFCRKLLFATFFSLVFLNGNWGWAVEYPQVVCVEEEWELVITTPDAQSIAPQVTTAFSPSSTMDELYITFEVNHQSQPDFVAGGMQLLVWQGESLLTTRKFPRPEVLATEGEVIQWTQRMTFADGQIAFEIINGSSSTWGEFGGQGYLVSRIDTTLPNLNGYRPTMSIDNSGVGYAANRVQSLILRSIRAVTATGEVYEDDTVRTPYQLQ